MSNIFKTIAPILGGIAGSILLPGIGTALGTEISALGGAAIGAGLGSGLETGIRTGNPLKGLLAGGLSGVGTYAGGQLAGNVLGTETGSSIGGALNQTPINVIGDTFGGSLAGSLGSVANNALGSATLGTTLGSALGSNVAQNVGSEALGTDFNTGRKPSTDYHPSQVSLSAPSGSADMSNLTPQQQSSFLATQGTYGSGLGTDQNKYFLNLINNRLVDQGGNLSSPSSLSNVEQSYLAQLGLGGEQDPNALLKRINNYQFA